MKITTTSFTTHERMPDHLVFCKPDDDTHCTFADNKNPQLAWTEVPDEARSLVLLCVDPDVPTVGDDVNREDRKVPFDLPRCDFYHWVMIDVPTDCTGFDEGACSDGVFAGGKTEPNGPVGSRQGANNYTDWFAGDDTMGGTYLGYDGPAPPWNDTIMHHYHFKLFALDVERLNVDGAFTGPEVIAAMEGHIIAECEVVGTYSLNPDLF